MPPEKKQINIGAIGVGAFMARQHLPNIKTNPRICIHTLCDLNVDLLKQRAAEYHPQRCTTEAESVFADPEIDAVLVGVRGRDHARFVELAARYRKHIYIEKPMTHTLAETRRVLQALKGVDINVGVGFNRRFAPIMVEAKKRFHGYRQGAAANIIYRIVDDHRIRPHYIFDLNDGGGHLLSEGCHIFDLLAWFLDQEPVEIYCAGPLETDNIAVVKYADGSLATILCGGKGGLMYPKELMEVFCQARTLAVDNFYELRFDGPDGNLIRTFPCGPKNRVPLAEKSMTGFYKALFAARPPQDVVGAHAANDLPMPAVDKGHSQAMAAFAEAIITGQKYSITAIDGARATVCALMGYESIRTNKPVPIRREDYGLTAGM